MASLDSTVRAPDVRTAVNGTKGTRTGKVTVSESLADDVSDSVRALLVCVEILRARRAALVQDEARLAEALKTARDAVSKAEEAFQPVDHRYLECMERSRRRRECAMLALSMLVTTAISLLLHFCG